jgi:branched-chain amino acid transport system substrate-binding protein
MGGTEMRKLWIIAIVVVLAVILLSVWQKKAKQNVMRIGVIAPLSGPSAKYGEDIRHGYDIAVEEVNAQGGIKGKKIVLVYEDSEGKPEKAVASAQKLIQGDRVIAILGDLWSSPTLAIAPICEKHKVPLLSSGASSPKITNAGDYVFRNEVSDEYGARRTAQLFFGLGFHSIAIIYVNNDFGRGFDNVVTETYKELGGKVVISESFDQDATDVRTQLIKIKQSSPQAILIVAYKESINIMRQMKEIGLRAQILGPALMEDPDIINKVGDVAEGAIYTYYGTFDPESQDKNIQGFVEKFRQKYGVNPEYYAPIGYDAVKILALAIECAGLEPDKIRDALYQVENFPGLSGTTSFDRNGDVVKPVILKQIKDGKFMRFAK